jgi:ribosomal protein S18 acetylase RimI-like enzyme
MAVSITPESPETVDARALVEELEEELGGGIYPDESQHGYSIEKLMAEGVAFFVVRDDGSPAGCGGVQIFGDYGELKRMYIRPKFRGRGLARLLVDHLATHARKQGAHLLRLETGIYQDEAIRLYEGMGFYEIPPFGPYVLDPNSVFYEREA